MDDLLQSFVVVGTIGDDDDTQATTKLVIIPDMGRSVVDSRDFPVIGEVLLREPPLLV